VHEELELALHVHDPLLGFAEQSSLLEQRIVARCFGKILDDSCWDFLLSCGVVLPQVPIGGHSGPWVGELTVIGVVLGVLERSFDDHFVRNWVSVRRRGVYNG
jgi:hypothetical protein